MNTKIHNIKKNKKRSFFEFLHKHPYIMLKHLNIVIKLPK